MYTARSELWKNIVKDGEFVMNARARIYGATGTGGEPGTDEHGDYRQYDTITPPTITKSLLSGNGISIGNCAAASLTFSIMTTDTVPKSACINIYGRVVDATNNNRASEWLMFGTYWVSKRTQNDDMLELECYDAMLFGNQVYKDNSQSMQWPKTIKTVVKRIVQQLSEAASPKWVVLSEPTEELLETSVGDLNIVTKPNSDETLLDILKYIGQILGGNWFITEKRHLRFVPILPPPEMVYIADHLNSQITTDDGDNLVALASNGDFFTGFGIINVPVVTGNITNGKENTITRVTLTVDADHIYSYPQTVDDDDTGIEIKCENNPYATDALCLALYNKLNGIRYVPFEMTGCTYDPEGELGDWIIAGDKVCGVLYSETRTLDVGFFADASAPIDDELEDEFPYKTVEEKMKYVTGEVGKTRTAITQTQHDVQIIAEDYTKASLVRSTFALDPTNITLTAGEDEHGQATGVITFNAGAIIINADNFTLTAEGIVTCNGANINGEFYNKTNNEPRYIEDHGIEYLDERYRNGSIRYSDGILEFNDIGWDTSVYPAVPASTETLMGKIYCYTNERLTIEGSQAVRITNTGETSYVNVSSYGINLLSGSTIKMSGSTVMLEINALKVKEYNPSSPSLLEYTGYTGTFTDANNITWDVHNGIITGVVNNGGVVI